MPVLPPSPLRAWCCPQRMCAVCPIAGAPGSAVCLLDGFLHFRPDHRPPCVRRWGACQLRPLPPSLSFPCFFAHLLWCPRYCYGCGRSPSSCPPSFASLHLPPPPAVSSRQCPVDGPLPSRGRYLCHGCIHAQVCPRYCYRCGSVFSRLWHSRAYVPHLSVASSRLDPFASLAVAPLSQAPLPK